MHLYKLSTYTYLEIVRHGHRGPRAGCYLMAIITNLQNHNKVIN